MGIEHLKFVFSHRVRWHAIEPSEKFDSRKHFWRPFLDLAEKLQDPRISPVSEATLEAHVRRDFPEQLRAYIRRSTAAWPPIDATTRAELAQRLLIHVTDLRYSSLAA